MLFLVILIGVGLLASSLPSGATATTLDTASLGTPDLFTPVVPGQPEGDDDKDNDDNGDENGDGVTTIDDLFLKVAKKHPGFGGVFVDEEKDTIFVFLKDGDLDEVVEELKKVLGEQSFRETKAQALEAKYSFLQLKQWHDRLAREVLGLPGVNMTDVDDAKNRILVGVENEKAEARVEQEVEKLDIPEEAVNIEVRGPIVAFNLTDRHRDPLAGGLQIASSDGSGCTLGFIVERGGGTNGEDVEGFVTASHCSDTPYAPDNTVYYQPTIADNNRIGSESGSEADDPSPFRCVLIFQCRNSDSSFATLEEGVPENGLGHIARPTEPNVDSVLCSDLETNDPLNPQFCEWDGNSTFRIIAERNIATPDTALVGRFVAKVGRSTGLTEGEVTGVGAQFTPVDPLTGSLFEVSIVDALRVDFGSGSAEGDSGSPVFELPSLIFPPAPGTSVDVILHGIFFASHDANDDGVADGDSYVSPMYTVEADLGELNTCAPSFAC